MHKMRNASTRLRRQAEHGAHAAPHELLLICWRCCVLPPAEWPSDVEATMQVSNSFRKDATVVLWYE